MVSGMQPLAAFCLHVWRLISGVARLGQDGLGMA